ncbi:MAG: copper chaperone PCu(A)C [Pseudomonadota bacterium]
MFQVNTFRVITTSIATAFLMLAFISSANAVEAGMKMHGDLVIENAWIRAAPAGAPVAGGYMKITNKGQTADKLVSVSAEFSGMSEIHEMSMEGDVMKMRPIDGLVIGPGETVELKPGGFHLMFMKPKAQVKDGDTHTVTLTFENAGVVEMDMPVGKAAAHH